MIYASKAFAFLVACVYAAHGLTLWPQPVDAQIGGASIAISKDFSLNYGGYSPVLLGAVDRSAQLLKSLYPTPTNDVVEGCKLIVHDENAPLVAGVDESYEIHVDGSDCSITSETVWGALHGIETLSQLVSSNGETRTLPSFVQITDYPRFGHRGILIDTSRHYLPLSDIHKTIDAMAQNKLNVLHWHVVDAQSFPFDSPSANEIVKGAYAPHLVYSFQDMEDTTAYAMSKGVRVIIEVDIPGHAASWGKGYPDIVANCPSKSGNINNVPLNPSREDTYDVVEAVLGDLHKATMDGYTHLGGDEVIYSCWNEDASIVSWKNSQGYSSWDDVYCAFVQRVDDMVRAAGRKPIHWEETYLTGCEIAKDTVIQVWIDQETIANVTAAGIQTIAAPQQYWYLDHMDSTWDVMYTYEPTTGLNEQQQANLLGGEACSWAETVDAGNIHTRVWPRAAAVAERLWSRKEVNDKDSAKTRLESHRCRMKQRGIPSQPIGPGFCQTDGL